MATNKVVLLYTIYREIASRLIIECLIASKIGPPCNLPMDPDLVQVSCRDLPRVLLPSQSGRASGDTIAVSGACTVYYSMACTWIKQSIIARLAISLWTLISRKSRAAICLACSSPPSQAVPQATRSPCQEHVQSIYSAACTGIKQSIIARLAISLWTLISRKSRAAICLACSSPPSQAVPQATRSPCQEHVQSIYSAACTGIKQSIIARLALGSKCWRLEVSRAGPGSPGWPGLVTHRRFSSAR